MVVAIIEENSATAMLRGHEAGGLRPTERRGSCLAWPSFLMMFTNVHCWQAGVNLLRSKIIGSWRLSEHIPTSEFQRHTIF